RTGYIADTNAEIVNRWEKAGIVTFGRTNTPEFGIKGIPEPDAWGSCKNPWNLKHNSGGSSGGSATAVAAAIVPIAGAGDGGGSIRIDRKSTRLNSSHVKISYAVFCLKKKKKTKNTASNN